MAWTPNTLYRHWLEIRGGLLVTGIATAIASVMAVLVVSQAGPGDEKSVLSAHAWATAFVAMLGAVLTSGSGVRTNDFEPGHASLLYTLTLPVARSSWIVTRFATGMAGVAGPVFMLFLVDALAFGASGQAVPYRSMAEASLIIGLVAVVTAAIHGTLLPVWRDWLQPFAGATVFTAMILFAGNAVNEHRPFPGWPTPIRSLVERGPDSANDLLVLVAATALIVAGVIRLATAIARNQDF